MVLGVLCLLSCNPKVKDPIDQGLEKTAVVVLGTVQDGGSPHIGCNKSCCKDLYANPDIKRKVTSLGLFDSETGKKYLFEASPDIGSQIELFNSICPEKTNKLPEAIFLTHAHIGHYMGLAYLGKEALFSSDLKIYAMPRMKGYLEQNGPWSQLVSHKNIKLHPIQKGEKVHLSSGLSVEALIVPHRDEFSETVGFVIRGKHKSVLFIPDIDKWEKWDRNILEEVGKVDYAFLDGTFFNGNELPNRNMDEVPHPFIVETLKLFKDRPDSIRKRLFFIHFNHTNPLLNEKSKEYDLVIRKGFKVAFIGQSFEL